MNPFQSPSDRPLADVIDYAGRVVITVCYCTYCAVVALLWIAVIALAVIWFANGTPANAGHRCVAAAKVVVQTQFVAVPVATPVGYPAYVSPVANVGMVAYGSAQQQASQTREAKSVDTPVPPSPDGVPYETYLAQFAQYLNVKNGATFQPQIGQPQPQPQAAPALTNIQQHCVRCHNPTKKDGSLDLTGEISLDMLDLSYDRITGETPHKTLMPPDKELTGEQLIPLMREIKGRIMAIAKKLPTASSAANSSPN